VVRTVVVTGASSGIGQVTAAAFAERGCRVIGTSRDPDTVPEAARRPGIEFRALDLADPTSIDSFGAGLGAVDVLVNNAGESQSGPLEELPAEAVSRLFQTNVFGHVRLTQLVLPGMRERGHGRVVMIGSMLASFPVAFRSSYVASKAALKGFATAARLELSPHGVWITTVEPGSVHTGIAERRVRYLAEDSVFGPDCDTVIASLDQKEAAGIAPERVARTIVLAAESRRPKPCYAVGNRAPLVFALRRLAPRSVLETMIARSFGLRR
jgi:short-subunit dehydrogenase